MNLKISGGKGINEKAYDINKNVIVAVLNYYRPLEVNNLLGDARKLEENLTNLSQIAKFISDMISSKCKNIRQTSEKY